MGYSNKQSAIIKVEKFLTLMVEATDESLEWQTVDPGKLSYYIREGIAAACFLYQNEPNNNRLLTFAKLKSKFIIKVKVGRVIAALRSEIPLPIMSVKKMKSIYLPNIVSLTQIIGAIAMYMVTEEKEQITIPNSSLSKDEFDKLLTYLKSKNIEVEVNENELVISRVEVSAKDTTN